LNWPQEFYVELIDKLSREAPVVITGTKMDADYLKVVESVREKQNVRWLVGDLKISELLDVLSQASGVVAPSTGVLHLAASLGTPAVGIYSPRKVEHPRRWGPRGPRVSALLPNVVGGSEARADVMREITPEQVYQRLTDLESGKNGATTRAHS
jgi:ADP-heptose:LPS heptosyltransferase